MWNYTGKWCTPVPGLNFTDMWHNVVHHDGDRKTHAIGYFGAAPRSFSIPAFKILALLASITVLFSSAVIASPGDIHGNTALHPDVHANDRLLPCIKRVEPVGDGNPHSSCRWTQMTSNLDCEGGTCSISHFKERTLGWELGFDANVKVPKGPSFGTAGFGVQESYTTGDTFTCDGGRHEKICVTSLVDYVDYTVRERVSSGWCGPPFASLHPDPYVIYAPSGEGNFRCHHNEHCHELGWERWDHNDIICNKSDPMHLGYHH